ncbi:hydroxymethylglutaryl-CoA reductase, degradative [Streptococcus cuniculipharyngis]|uniref:3-hydroxy-3-methylglutaryl coenzyme A reductase n=1 Tax=Streptococcus cuniculipharyngis TaxID=1562651 RepID=A0A5C5SFT3_9STRE|nr:hydroxymethylglutaryl-CoA reductase, degradative [Streptococcus cuniculipharyngis]TWS98761.1 hydroxymethylglutaryl-CoA reductase, degradative [Streptococcus cuniculipharyngis]
MTINWTGFAKKTPEERRELLQGLPLSDQSSAILQADQQLPLAIANQMAEHVLGRFSLPFSLVPDVLVDGQLYHLPFVTEEPSVVAAASFASKIIKRSGGFTTTIHQRQMIGQVILYDVSDLEQARQNILAQKEDLLDLANQAYPSIVKRGGGARDLEVKTYQDQANFLAVFVKVDTQEAMGANMVNTMMEALKFPLEQISQAKSLMAILSNYATESLVTAKCAIDLRFLSRDKKEARHLADKLVLASQFAKIDPYRASTHNKGIFNGIDAASLALGNDWRAIEAGGHAYASRHGSYQGLTTWTYCPEKEQVLGELTLPMPAASKGGSIGLNPSVQLAHDILGNPDAKTLAKLLVSIGLAQNFAALKALVSTGIQSGHMKLHAKSLALLAGAEEHETGPLVQALLQEQHMNLATAQKILTDLRNNG